MVYKLITYKLLVIILTLMIQLFTYAYYTYCYCCCCHHTYYHYKCYTKLIMVYYIICICMTWYDICDMFLTTIHLIAATHTITSLCHFFSHYITWDSKCLMIIDLFYSFLVFNIISCTFPILSWTALTLKVVISYLVPFHIKMDDVRVLQNILITPWWSAAA